MEVWELGEGATQGQVAVHGVVELDLAGDQVLVCDWEASPLGVEGEAQTCCLPHVLRQGLQGVGFGFPPEVCLHNAYEGPSLG